MQGSYRAERHDRRRHSATLLVSGPLAENGDASIQQIRPNIASISIRAQAEKQAIRIAEATAYAM
jgi:hypothetical protein